MQDEHKDKELDGCTFKPELVTQKYNGPSEKRELN